MQDNLRADLHSGDTQSNLSVVAPPFLRQQWGVLVRRRWIVGLVVLGALIAGSLVTLFMQPLYVASVTLEISRSGEKVVRVDNLDQQATADDREFYQTQYSLLEARSLAESVANKFNLSDDKAFFSSFGVDTQKITAPDQQQNLSPEQKRKLRFERAVGLLQEHIIIDPLRNSRLVTVSFRSPDPKLSQKIANAWANAFIENQLSKSYASSSYARSFLEARLIELRKRLEASERTAVEFAIANNIVNISTANQDEEGTSRTERSLESDTAVALNEALAEARATRIKAEARLGQKSTTSNVDDPSNLLSSLRQRKAEIEAQVAGLEIHFESGYPALASLRTQLNSINQSIAAEQSRIRQGILKNVQEARANEAALAKSVNQTTSEMLNSKAISAQYAIYQREADTNRQIYDALLQRYKELGATSGSAISNVVIVDEATIPKDPSSPRLGLNLVLSAAIGLIIAALIVFVLEQINERIKEPSEIERNFGLALLGVIPKTLDEPEQAIQNTASDVSEAYVSLQAVLQIASRHGTPKTIAVTSSQKGEGKSTTSYAMSELLARTGARVIIVDADMRAPSLHKYFKQPNKVGLSNFLSGNHDLRQLIVETRSPRLSLLTAGPKPPNAAELLIGSNFDQLVSRLSQDYDYVIFDAPPVAGMADAPLIASAVSAVIFVTEANGPRVNLVRVALQRLMIRGANVIGILLTKFDPKETGYGYGYGYGYGDEADVGQETRPESG